MDIAGPTVMELHFYWDLYFCLLFMKENRRDTPANGATPRPGKARVTITKSAKVLKTAVKNGAVLVLVSFLGKKMK